MGEPAQERWHGYRPSRFPRQQKGTQPPHLIPSPPLPSPPHSKPPHQPHPQTKKTLIPTRLNATINRLEKTRKIRSADELQAAKEEYMSAQRAEKRREAERKRKEEERVGRERREEREGRERGYEKLDDEGGKRSNVVGWDEEDFM